MIITTMLVALEDICLLCLKYSLVKNIMLLLVVVVSLLVKIMQWNEEVMAVHGEVDLVLMEILHQVVVEGILEFFMQQHQKWVFLMMNLFKTKI